MEGVSSGGSMSEREQETANKSARFWPQAEHLVDGTRPAIEVAGLMVFVYIKHGALRVAVDLDETDERLTRGDGIVPLVISVQGTEVFRTTQPG